MAAFALKQKAVIGARAAAGGLTFALAPRSLVSRVAALDTDARRFLVAWKKASPDSRVRVNGYPPCFGLEADSSAPDVDNSLWLDLLDSDGVISPHRYVEWYIRHGYRAKSHRCETCAYNDVCGGMPINYLRHFGFKQLQPVEKSLRNTVMLNGILDNLHEHSWGYFLAHETAVNWLVVGLLWVVVSSICNHCGFGCVSWICKCL